MGFTSTFEIVATKLPQQRSPIVPALRRCKKIPCPPEAIPHARVSGGHFTTYVSACVNSPYRVPSLLRALLPMDRWVVNLNFRVTEQASTVNTIFCLSGNDGDDGQRDRR